MVDATRQTVPIWLTRRAVAKRLGKSVASVRRLEGRLLHPQRSQRGVWLFARDEVERVAAATPSKPRPRAVNEGEIASRAFEMFRAGEELRNVVLELRQHPRVIRELYDEWRIILSDGYDAKQRARDEREQERWIRSLRR